jgi:hypothetical protein
MVVASVSAQFDPRSVRSDRLLLAVQGDLESPELHKELGLKPEQVKRWFDALKKHRDTQDTTPVKDYDRDAAAKFLETALLEVLTPEQKTRLRQIAFQWVVRNRFGFVNAPGLAIRSLPLDTLARFPDLAEALKIDEVQKKLVERYQQELEAGEAVALPPGARLCT